MGGSKRRPPSRRESAHGFSSSETAASCTLAGPDRDGARRIASGTCSSSVPAHVSGTGTGTGARTGKIAPAPTPLRIAILLNSYRSRILPAIRASYQRTIWAVEPDARLVFYEPANRSDEKEDGESFPDPAAFDLVVLGGGNVDPRKRYPWILDVHDFVRRLARDHPRKKLLGICWGHQTICTVFGGKVVDAPVPEMGVASINLTARGREFFPEASTLGSFRLQQHHRREVAAAPDGFAALAHGNQCLLSESGAVLTFQGHPEKDAETARLRLHDTARWFGFDALSDEKAWARLQLLIDEPHDGEMVWRRVFQWVREDNGEEERELGTETGVDNPGGTARTGSKM